MHITGDSSLALVISLMKALASGDLWKMKRVRIEHNPSYFITEQEMMDLRDLGVYMMHSPKFGHAGRIRTLLENQINLGISPDGSTNAFADIMTVTSDQRRPSENITREQAVIAYTRTNAFAEFEEHRKGTLQKGMLADLVVLSADLFSVTQAELPAVTSVLTIIDGKIVYEAKQ